jgi:hypothetical protein
MAGNNSNGKDIPERAKIAQLLAELMPPLPTAKMQPATATPITARAPEESHPIFDSPGLALDDLDFDSLPAIPPAPVVPPIAPLPPAQPLRQSTPEIKPAIVLTSRTEAVAEPITPLVPVHVTLAAEAGAAPPATNVPPPPQLATEPANSFLAKANWRNAPEERPTPVVAAPSRPAAQRKAPGADLIPLGNVTMAGYFTLMNWRNQPEMVRHPIRDPLAGIEKETITLAKSIPFFGYGSTTGSPWSVAEVMLQFAWE